MEWCEKLKLDGNKSSPRSGAEAKQCLCLQNLNISSQVVLFTESEELLLLLLLRCFCYCFVVFESSRLWGLYGP